MPSGNFNFLPVGDNICRLLITIAHSFDSDQNIRLDLYPNYLTPSDGIPGSFLEKKNKNKIPAVQYYPACEELIHCDTNQTVACHNCIISGPRVWMTNLITSTYALQFVISFSFKSSFYSLMK